MAFRFVHAADIHLDSPLKSLALRDADLATLIATATRQAFVRVVDLCLEERVDALLLAGDLYDGEQTSMLTARFLAEQLKRLDEAAIRTFVIRGNHDHLSRITRELTLPLSVHVFDHSAGAIALDAVAGGLEVVVHGLSFREAKAPRSLLPRYRTPVAGAVNIALMHTSLGGTPPHDHYAPCALADLQASGFQYWALGHIHGRDVHRHAARADAAVVMPGIPQGRDINEAGAKSATLVTVADDRSITVEERLTSVAQFERVAVDLDGAEDWREALSAIEAGLGRARAAAVSDHVVVRLVVAGATPLAPRLRRDFDLLREDVGLRAAELGRVSIDKVELGTAAPAEALAPGDLFAELQQLLAIDVLPSSEFRTAMADLADDLRRKLPPECRDAVLGAAGCEDETLALLAAEGAGAVLERLRDVAAADP